MSGQNVGLQNSTLLHLLEIERVYLQKQAQVNIDWCCKQFIGDVFTITEKALTRAFSWLKVPTSALTFRTIYAKQALTPK